MAVAALSLTAAFVLLPMAARIGLNYRRTGDTGVRFARSAGATQRWAWAAIVLGGGTTGAVAPLTELALGAGIPGVSTVAPPTLPVPATVRLVGLLLAAASTAATLAAQTAMGASWRLDVDWDRRNPLVTGKAFALVRNPIYTAGLVWAAGLALACPGVISIVGLAVMAGGVEVLVRRVEEPYLAALHGAAYRQYTGRVGRFVPGLGTKPRIRWADSASPTAAGTCAGSDADADTGTGTGSGDCAGRG